MLNYEPTKDERVEAQSSVRGEAQKNIPISNWIKEQAFKIMTNMLKILLRKGLTFTGHIVSPFERKE